MDRDWEVNKNAKLLAGEIPQLLPEYLLSVSIMTLNPIAAAAKYPERERWEDIMGLKIHREVLKVEPGEDWNAAWTFYQTKFPFINSLKGLTLRNQINTLIPDWIRLVDNTKGFGFKQEWGLENV